MIFWHYTSVAGAVFLRRNLDASFPHLAVIKRI